MEDDSLVTLRPNTSSLNLSAGKRESVLKYQLKLKEPDYTRKEEYT